MKRVLRVIVMGLAGVFASTACLEASEKTVRAAMLNFTSVDEFNYSLITAAQYTAMIQAGLFDTPGVQWIERAELESAVNELDLGVLSSQSTSRLRLGKWVKAQWLIVGRFTVGRPMTRTLSIEIIDVQRAEVVAQGTLRIDNDTRDAVYMTEADVSKATALVKQLLEQAKQAVTRAADQRIVAPLFFRNISKTTRLDYLENDIYTSMRAAGEASSEAHVLEIVRAGQVAGESELAILGLAENDAQAFRQVADVYVWGSYRESDQYGGDFQLAPVDISITASDGVEFFRELTASTVVKSLKQTIDDLTGKVLAEAVNAPTRPPRPPQIALKLLARAEEIEKAMPRRWSRDKAFIESDYGQAMRKHLINTLEAARFFDPTSRAIHWQMLEARWADRYPHGITDRWRKACDYISFRRLHGLVAKDRQGDDVIDKAFVERYCSALSAVLRSLSTDENRDTETAQIGSSRRPDDHWNNIIAGELVDTIVKVVELIPNHKRPEVWRHVYGNWAALVKSISDVHLRVKLVEAIWPAYKPVYVEFLSRRKGPAFGKTTEDYIAEAYEATGKSDRIEALFSVGQVEIKPAPRPQRTNTATHSGRSRPVTLVQTTKRETSKTKSVLNSTITAIPIADAACRNMSFETRQNWFQRRKDKQGGFDDRRLDPTPHLITAMEFAQGRLWMAAAVRSEYGQYDKHCLLCYQPASDTLINVSDKLGKHSKINDLRFDGKHLWLALELDGVWRIDGETFELQRFTGKDGLLTPTMRRIALAKDRLLFAGVTSKKKPVVNTCDRSSERWGQLAMPSQAGFLDSTETISAVTCFDKWVFLAASTDAAVLDADAGQWSQLSEAMGVPRAAAIRYALADKSGVYLFRSGKLFHFDPKAKRADTIEFDKVYACGMVDDGQILYLAVSVAFNRFQSGVEIEGIHQGQGVPDIRSDRYFILAWHKARKQWISRYELPMGITSLAVSPHRLWVATVSIEEPLAVIDKQTLLTATEYQPTMAGVVSEQKPASKSLSIPIFAVVIGVAVVLGVGLIVMLRKKRQTLILAILASAAAVCCGASPANDVTARDAFGATALMHAAWNADEGAVVKLIEAGADVNASTPKGFSALTAACRNGSLPIVKMLVQHGASLDDAVVYATDARTRNAATPLHIAAEMGHTDIVAWLIGKGVSVDQRTAFGETALMTAANNGRTATVRLLLDSGADIDAVNVLRQSALWLAADRGCTQTVKLLIERNAGISIADHSDTSALMTAIEHGHNDVAEVLIEAGADVSQQRRGWKRVSALSTAMEFGDDELVAMLIARGAADKLSDRQLVPMIFDALRNKQANVARSLLDKVSRVSRFQDKSRNLLVAAVQAGDEQIVCKLLNSQFDLDAPYEEGTAGGSALGFAVREGRIDLAKMLLDAGVDANAPNHSGGCALAMAMFRQQIDSVKLLVSCGADPNFRAKNGKTAMDYLKHCPQAKGLLKPAQAEAQPAKTPPTVENENPWLLKYRLRKAPSAEQTDKIEQMLANGVDPNLRQNQWPLIVKCAARGQTHAVTLLAERGADVNARGPDNWTALILAAVGGHAQTVNKLIELGADPHATNLWGKTAMDLARQWNHTETIQVLNLAGVDRSDNRCLITAALWNKTDAIEVLTAAGMDINARGAQGSTALHAKVCQNVIPGDHYAVYPIDTIRWLLDHGADPNVQDNAGCTALTLAVKTHPERIDIVKLLIERGASGDIEDKTGNTPRTCVQEVKNPGIKRQLLQLLGQ